MSTVLLHGLGRGPSDWDGVRAALGDVVVPALPRDPARAIAAARSAVVPGSVLAHRVAFVRSMRRRSGSSASSTRALLSLVRQAARPGGFGAGVSAPVLVVHAVDDHHVPVDFALAAARSRGWDLRVLPAGGHHAHVVTPEPWLEAVVPWLRPEPCAPPRRTPRG